MNQHYDVAILLCTYNGEKYLKDQLDSIENQSHPNWRVIVSDDDSIDHTFAILEEYQKKWGHEKLTIRRGPREGFCKNFLSLATDTHIQADFYCFCDQDDVWLRNKLEVAVRHAVNIQDPNIPFVYCGRTTYVDKDLLPFGMSPLFLKPKTFQNALVQSLAGGNTMLFNHATKKILEIAGTLKVPSHDWWVYQLVTGLNGIVYYDSESHILYRQHSDTIIGGNTTLKDKIYRLQLLINGQLTDWFDQSYIALNSIYPLLSKENQDLLIKFNHFKRASFFNRMQISLSFVFYRQTTFGNLSFLFACFINKI